jgi:predicted transcriptional regulator
MTWTKRRTENDLGLLQEHLQNKVGLSQVSYIGLVEGGRKSL